MALSHQFETLDPRSTSEWSCTFTNAGYGAVTEDISALITQMSIYESIFNNCMFGNIKIQDGTGLVEANGIVGSGLEKVHFEVLTENVAGPLTTNLEKIFTIDSISTGIKSPKFTEYDIGIVSPYLIKNNKIKISRSFLKMTASEIAEYVGADVLEFEAGEPNWASFDVSPTLHEKNTVVPNWNPFQLLNFLARNSVSANGESNYLFFENNDGFKFAPLDELKAKPSRRLLQLKNMPTKILQDPSGFVVDNAMMDDYSESSRFTLSGGQTTGRYGTAILTHNILEKWLRPYEVIYDGPKDKIMAEGIGLNGPEAKQFADFNTWQHSGFMSHNYLYDIHDKGEKSHYPLHDMKKTEMRANVVKFDIPGDTNIHAGDVITLRIPTHIHSHDEPEDQYLTGNWLVSAIHHKISNNGYTCTLECMKDGFFSDPDITIPKRKRE